MMSNFNTNPYAESSSGDSELTPDCPSIPDDMTEERAMEIWLARDEEIEQERLRLHRERRARLQQENQYQQQPGELQRGNYDAYQHRQQHQVMAQREEAHREHHQLQLQQAYRIQTQHQEAVERERRLQAIAIAAQQQAMLEAQNHAIIEARNHRGHSVSESHFPSQRNDYSSIMMGGDSNWPQPRSTSAGLTDQVREYERLSSIMGGNMGSQSPGLAAQVQEFERLSLAHRTQATPPPIITPSSNNSLPTNNDTSNEKKKKKRAGENIRSTCLATTNRTEHSIIPVRCFLCNTNLYAHPLATSYSCQICSRLSVMRVEDMDPGEKFEQKMADVGDEQGDVDMNF